MSKRFYVSETQKKEGDNDDDDDEEEAEEEDDDDEEETTLPEDAATLTRNADTTTNKTKRDYDVTKPSIYDVFTTCKNETNDDVFIGFKNKRPISYPWGPETKVELILDDNNTKLKLKQTNNDDVDALKKRYSDPSKLTGTRFGASSYNNTNSNSNKDKVKVQVKPFTKESLERLERKTVQLVREYGFQPRRKLSVEDGSRLPSKYEPFPTKLYGRPLEEIDNFIYDEVSLVRSISNEILLRAPCTR